MGTYSSILTLFEDVTKDLTDAATFDYGVLSDFNSRKNVKYPLVWVEIPDGEFDVLNTSVVGNSIPWNFIIDFVDLDDKTGNNKETAEKHDKMFDLMEKWLHKLDRQFLNNETDSRIQSGNIEIVSATFKPARKITDTVITGWALTLQMRTLSTFDYCSIYEDE